MGNNENNWWNCRAWNCLCEIGPCVFFFFLLKTLTCTYILKLLSQWLEYVNFTHCVQSQNTELKKIEIWALWLPQHSQYFELNLQSNHSNHKHTTLARLAEILCSLNLSHRRDKNAKYSGLEEERDSIILWFTSCSIYIRRTELRDPFICLHSNSIKTKPNQKYPKSFGKMNYKTKDCYS